jgi:hypothetical protein
MHRSNRPHRKTLRGELHPRARWSRFELSPNGLRQPLHVKGRLTSNRRLRLAVNEPAQRRQTALFFGRDPV